MEDAPLPRLVETPKKMIKEILEINQENKNYKLHIEIEEVIMKFKIIDDDPFIGTYSKIFTMNEIKELYQGFSMLNSFKEFFDYLKALASNKKIKIDQTGEYIVINLAVEYLLKQNNIEIILTQEEINYKKISKELKDEISLMKDKINDLENKFKEIIDRQKEEKQNLIQENYNIREEIKKLQDENKNIKDELNICINYIKEIKGNNEQKNIITKNYIINSSIMESDDFNMLKTSIESRIQKEIKDLKKLYQATIDGEDSSNFHKKCDNIPNTLILIKSAENRRFGGFTSECWESSIKTKYDKNAFLFSLDKKKIYKCKKDNYSICCYSVNGPCFGFGNTIKIGKNPVKEKSLRTYESNPQCSYEFDGDVNALSEDGKFEGIFAKEYEVFQVNFSL